MECNAIEQGETVRPLSKNHNVPIGKSGRKCCKAVDQDIEPFLVIEPADTYNSKPPVR